MSELKAEELEHIAYMQTIEIQSLTARIAELEAEVTKCHELQDSYCDRIAELEGKIDQLTAHSDIERQDDKSSNDTQTRTIVYGWVTVGVTNPLDSQGIVTRNGGEG